MHRLDLDWDGHENWSDPMTQPVKIKFNKKKKKKKGTGKLQVRAKQNPEVENVFDIALFYCLTKGGNPS